MACAAVSPPFSSILDVRSRAKPKRLATHLCHGSKLAGTFMYIDRDERTTARRAEWLGRVAITLADAQRLVRSMLDTGADAPELADLLARIAVLRTRLELHQRATGAYLPAADEHLAAGLSRGAIPPMHDHVP